MKTDRLQLLVFLFLCMWIGDQTVAQENKDADLAQELTNPIADLVTIPIQMNFDNDIGVNDEGSKTTTNIQPVIPFEINTEWNLITRTIFPIISQDNIIPGAGSQSGLGDITEQLFFSPKKPTASGIIWGVGAVSRVSRRGSVPSAIRMAGPRSRGLADRRLRRRRADDAMRHLADTADHHGKSGPLGRSVGSDQRLRVLLSPHTGK